MAVPDTYLSDEDCPACGGDVVVTDDGDTEVFACQSCEWMQVFE